MRRANVTRYQWLASGGLGDSGGSQNSIFAGDRA